MAAKTLATIDDVRRRMFLPDIDGVKTAIKRTLEGATTELEAELRTVFDLQTGLVDTFYVPDSDLSGSRFAERFRLSRGLVDENTTALQVEIAHRRLQFLPGNTGEDPLDLRDTSEALVDDPDQYVMVNAERGVVTIQDFRLLRQYIQITYDAGIATDPNKADLYLQTGTNSVPAWLKELAILTSMIELTSTPQTGIDETARAQLKSTLRPAELQRKKSGLLDDYTRYEPGSNKILTL